MTKDLQGSERILIAYSAFASAAVTLGLREVSLHSIMAIKKRRYHPADIPGQMIKDHVDSLGIFCSPYMTTKLEGHDATLCALDGLWWTVHPFRKHVTPHSPPLILLCRTVSMAKSSNSIAPTFFNNTIQAAQLWMITNIYDRALTTSSTLGRHRIGGSEHLHTSSQQVRSMPTALCDSLIAQNVRLISLFSKSSPL
jgi:hypothetical protein